MIVSLKSRLSAALLAWTDALYGIVAGVHPNVQFWHFQWLPGTILLRTLRPVLLELRGDVLDVGCGTKPYGAWMSGVLRHVGMDIEPGPRVDVVAPAGQRFPFDDESFDAVLCTQVLEHVAAPEFTVSEIVRVLRPGGKLVLTVPFIYGEHGLPHDYRRFTRQEIPRLLGAEMEVVEVVRQGAAGSTLGALFLGWFQTTVGPKGRFLLLSVLLPFWLGLTAAVNGACWVLDRLDRTGGFYGNVLAIAIRSPADYGQPVSTSGSATGESM